MDKEFNIISWNLNKSKLMKRYPQLTNADLIWRHETKNDLFMVIADKLGLSRKEFEEIIESY
jgi:hypothetical protein